MATSDLGPDEVELLSQAQVSSSGFNAPSVQGLTNAVDEVRYKLSKLARLNGAQLSDVKWTLVAVAKGKKVGVIEGGTSEPR